MVIVIKTGTPEAAIRQLLAQLAAQNVKGGCVAGPNGILLPLVGDTPDTPPVNAPPVLGIFWSA